MDFNVIEKQLLVQYLENSSGGVVDLGLAREAALDELWAWDPDSDMAGISEGIAPKLPQARLGILDDRMSCGWGG